MISLSFQRSSRTVFAIISRDDLFLSPGVVPRFPRSPPYTNSASDAADDWMSNGRTPELRFRYLISVFSVSLPLVKCFCKRGRTPRRTRFFFTRGLTPKLKDIDDG